MAFQQTFGKKFRLTKEERERSRSRLLNLCAKYPNKVLNTDLEGLCRQNGIDLDEVTRGLLADMQIRAMKSQH